MTSLRDELERIGESAAHSTISAHTWARARRANRRSRLMILSGAAALVILVGSVTFLGFTGFGRGSLLDNLASSPVEAIAGVPDFVYAVPARLTATDDLSPIRAVTSDLAIGQASIAFVATPSTPTVVTASDGKYHLLKLPHVDPDRAWSATISGTPWLALAPNGKRLAYSWAAPDSRRPGEPMPVGITIINLIDGSDRSVDVTGGDGVQVDGLSWSPNSEWLAWTGNVTKSWRDDRRSYRGQMVGRIAVDTATAEQTVKPKGGFAALSISSSGVLHLIGKGTLFSWPESVETAAENFPDTQDPVSHMSPEGKSLVAGAVELGDRMALVDVESGGNDSRRLPLDEFPAGAALDSFGWIDEKHVVVEVITPDDEVASVGGGFTWAGRDIAILSSPADSTDFWKLDGVARIQVGYADIGGISSLSIAVDLMSLESPTVPAVEPDWPWSSERKWMVFGVPAFLGLIIALWWWGELGKRRFAPLLRS